MILSGLVKFARQGKHRLRAALQGPRFAQESTASYSQCGEDRIAAFLFQAMEISRPTYFDIGANDPVKLSNTYLLYRTGSRGVCIEPNPILYKKLTRVRPRDTCLNVGIGATASASMPFYQFGEQANGLSTFSKDQAESNAQFFSFPIEQVLEIPLRNVNTILSEHFPTAPNFLSLDVEGLDLEILQSWNFASHAPEVICAETIRHEAGKSLRDEELIRCILDKGYLVYADTYVNTLFVRADRFPSV